MVRISVFALLALASSSFAAPLPVDKTPRAAVNARENSNGVHASTATATNTSKPQSAKAGSLVKAKDSGNNGTLTSVGASIGKDKEAKLLKEYIEGLKKSIDKAIPAAASKPGQAAPPPAAAKGDKKAPH